MVMASGLILSELASLSVLVACSLVMLNPLIWTLINRFEYKTHAISPLCRGPRAGTTVWASLIMGMNVFRTSVFHYMAVKGTKLHFFEANVGATTAGYLIIVLGVSLVLSTHWRLGFFGSFYGDCFGILLHAKVTEFPYNILDHPMYWGSFMIHFGGAIVCASAVGFLLSLAIGLSYAMVAVVEAPLTAEIYAAKKA